MMKSILGRVSAGEDLSMAEMAETIGNIMSGKCEESEIALLLTALRAKGETIDEVAGAAQAMRDHMTPIQSNHEALVDTCGTGGDGSGTFNISTAAAFVTAAAGIPVAKHGNRSVSSKTGSADVLEQLGVNVDAELPVVEACLDKVGICFCYARLFHQSMKHVAAVRKQLGVPTIFNLLGPLCNPARAPFQLLGVGRPEIRNLLAAALSKLGTTRSAVVCGADGLDEVTTDGETNVTEVAADGTNETTWSPEQFGLERSSKESMLVENPAESAELIRRILAGEAGPSRDVVVLNAAASIWLANPESTPKQCAAQAAEAIDTGRAKATLEELAASSKP